MGFGDTNDNLVNEPLGGVDSNLDEDGNQRVDLDAGGLDIDLSSLTGFLYVDSGQGYALSASSARTNMGLGSIATQDANTVNISGGSISGITDLAIADGGTGASNAAGARTNLGLVIGSDVQAWDTQLDDIAALGVTDGNIIVGDGANWVAESGATARTSLGLAIGSDVQAHGDILDDLNTLGAASSDGEFIVATGAGVFAYESGATARTSLGLGSIATFAGDQDLETTDSPTFVNLTLTGYQDFNEIAAPSAPSADISRLYAFDFRGQTQLRYKTNDGDIVTLARDNLIVVRNDTGSTITKGSAVYISGSTGNTPQVTLAKADSASTMPAIGLAHEDIGDNSFGHVMTHGILTNVDMSAFTEGDTVYVSAATAGALTNTAPTFSNLRQAVGLITNDLVAGAIEVDVEDSEGRGYYDDAYLLIDSNNSNVTNGNIPYMSASGFANSSLSTDGTNVGINNTDHDFYLHVTGLATQSNVVLDSPTGGAMSWFCSTPDNVSMLFDAVYDSGWVSKDAGSNFAITKVSDRLKFRYGSGVAVGDIVTWNEGITLRDNGRVGFGGISPVTAFEIIRNEPYITLHNSTHEDTDGGRESRIIARGEQSGGEESILGYLEFAHDGSSDDEKGLFRVLLNDGNDSTTPSLTAFTCGSTGEIQFHQTAHFDAEVDNGNSGATDTIDWTAGNKQKSTLTNNCEFTFSPEPSGPCGLTLKLIQDGTGSRTVTWPADVKWPGGTAPTLSTGAGAVDIISFHYDGTDFYGQSALDFS